ncbi:hypothetical protein D3C87_1683310 [compost metagenome]
MPAGKSKYYLKLTTEFTVDHQDEQNMQLVLKNIVVKRDAPKFESYTKAVTELPKVICGEGQ